MTEIDPQQIPPGALEAMVRKYIPHCGALNMTLDSYEKGRATVALPYDDKILGDPDHGFIAGGAIATAIDSAMGIAVFAALARIVAMATLDLRIDYLKPARAGRKLLATAHCYRKTSRIAFVRATAYHPGEEDDPVASAMAAFMLESSEAIPLDPAKLAAAAAKAVQP